MKSYRDRLMEYEYQKTILMQTCKTSEELMQKLKALAKELKI